MSVNHLWKISIILYITVQAAWAAKLRCYKNSSDNFVEVSFKQFPDLVNSSYIKPGQELVIVIHGYEDSPDAILIVGIIKSLIETFGDTKSYCALNWKGEASAYIGPIAQPIKDFIGIRLLGIDYFLVSIIAAGVGKYLGTSLVGLKPSGIQMNDIYMIGHSEGAHLAGAAGRVVKSSGDLIGRITGLDAAHPAIEKHLDKSCAKVVDVVHTNPGLYGTNKAIGHIDFWLNCGCSVQPGCKKWTIPLTLNNLCSHIRAPFIMAEAVKYPDIFISRKANSCDNFKKSHGDPDPEDINRIGFNVIPNNTGSFYMCTNAEPIYGRGRGGMDPANCTCKTT